jgi:hypothetical protein
MRKGDAIVAGRNFGMGSNRPASRSLRNIGIGFLLAESINGLFFRNSVNFGFLALECPGCFERAKRRRAEPVARSRAAARADARRRHFPADGEGGADRAAALMPGGADRGLPIPRTDMRARGGARREESRPKERPPTVSTRSTARPWRRRPRRQGRYAAR